MHTLNLHMPILNINHFFFLVYIPLHSSRWKKGNFSCNNNRVSTCLVVQGVIHSTVFELLHFSLSILLFSSGGAWIRYMQHASRVTCPNSQLTYWAKKCWEVKSGWFKQEFLRMTWGIQYFGKNVHTENSALLLLAYKHIRSDKRRNNSVLMS